MPQTAVPSRLSDASFAEEPERSSIRIHSPSLRAAAVMEPTPSVTPSGRPLAYLKYRWVTVLFLGGFLASVLAFTAWSLIPSKYTTNSLVRVLSDNPVVHSKEDLQGRSDFAIYLKSQAAMIKSHFVLNAALRDPNIASFAMLREQPDPVRYLEEELKVEFQDGSEILKISLSGDDPRAISQIVNAIQESYFREVVDEEALRKKARLLQLEDSISKMQEEVKRRQAQNKQTDLVNPVNDPNSYLGANIAVSQLLRFKEILGKVESDIASWEAEKASLGKKLGNVADEVPPPTSLLESLDKDPKMAGLTRRIDQLTAKIDYLIKVSGDANLASVVDLKQKISEAQEDRERFKREHLAEYQKNQMPIVEKKLKGDLEKCASTLIQLAVQKKKLDTEIEEYQKTVNQNGSASDSAINFPMVDVRERAKIITEMLDKANLLRLEVNAPPRVRDFQRAAVPLKRDMRKQIFGTIFAGLVGFGLVGFGVIRHESRVRRAMSLADVQRSVLGPMAGILPPRSDQSPASAAAGEAIEKTRTHLLQQFGRPGGKVIAVTSALTEEGKAYLAWKFAENVSVSGGRTLLVDFDLRSPSLHQELNVANERGVCDVLTGKVDLSEILASQASGLTFLPAGTWTAEVRHGLTPERLEALLHWLRAQFDVVILNTHPLLAVAETVMLCRNADAVLLSVERNESRLPLVNRAYEKLAAAAPEVLGIVYQGATAEECMN